YANSKGEVKAFKFIGRRRRQPRIDAYAGFSADDCRSSSKGEPAEVLHLAAARTLGPRDRDLSGEEPAAHGPICSPGRGRTGAIARGRGCGHSLARWELALGRINDARLRPRAAALATRIRDRVPARLEARHGPRQRSGLRRGAFSRLPHPRPANGRVAGSLPLERGVLGKE